MRFRFKPTVEQRAALGVQLARLRQPAPVLAILRSSLPADFQPASVSCTPHGVHSDRFVMCARVQSHAGEAHTFALKVYSDDFGERVWAHSLRLAAHHRPNHDGLCLPIRYVPHERMLVFPWVDGRSLSEVVDGRTPEMLRRAAHLAADLHRLAIAPEHPTTAQMIVDETLARCERLRSRWPEVAPTVEPLMGTLQEAVPCLDSSAPAPIHGDMGAEQFVRAGERLVLLDLDMFGYADPAYDAGYFLAQLERRRLSDATLPPCAREWPAAFRDAYLAAMPAVSAGNVSFYRGLTLVRKMYTVSRGQAPGWRTLVRQLAKGARVALEEVPTVGRAQGGAGYMTPLPATLDPGDTQTALSAALREARGAGARLEGWTADVHFTEHGKQRVARYDLQAHVPGESHVQHFRWVGKLYDRDDDARRVAAVLRALATSDCGTRGGVVVPRVLAYYAPRRLLLMTYETGESVASAIAQSHGAVLTAVGRALAALHATPVSLDAIRSPAAVLEDVRPRIADLSARFPDEAATLRDALALLECEPPLGPTAPAFVHGDFGPANLLWRMGDLVVLDFDKCARGDPALDLGNLLTQLRRITLRKPGTLPDFPSMRSVLLDAYQRSAPPDPGLVVRVAWYERATQLRKVHFLVSNTMRHKEAEAIRQRQAEAIGLMRCIKDERDSVRSC